MAAAVNTTKILKAATPFETFKGAYVYFLLRLGIIVYVGQSKSLGSRISTHKKGKDFDAVKYLEVPVADQNVLEMALIKSIKPIYNTQSLGAMTDKEMDILRKYDFEEETISQILRSQRQPERHEYGYVGYFDEDGNPQVGLYDGENDFEEHEDECQMGHVEEIIGETEGILHECLLNFCKCEPEAIVMDGFLTYQDIPRDELYVVTAPEFQPFREKFDKTFLEGYENQVGENGSEETKQY